MNNTLPPEIESLCVQEVKGRKVPLWPYIVAVTGHRTFAKPGEVEGLPGYERDTIKETFRKELEQMARQWKTSCGKVNAPFILLTGLAAGADQLAAEAALELPEELNVKVAAILPMDKELFRLTIKDRTEQERFDSLLERVHMTYALPLLDDSPEYRAKLANVNNPETESLRNMQYKKLGKVLAQHSHVLFALWDGMDKKDLVGGTSMVLHFKLEGNTENQTRSDILTYTSVGPVVQFLLPRNNEKDNQDTPVAELKNPEEIAVFYWSKHNLWDKKKKCYFFPSREQMTEEKRCKTSVARIPEIVDVINRIGDLNRQSLRHSRKWNLQKQEADSQRYLFEGRSGAEDFCDAETEILVRHYTYADRMADFFKDRMLRVVTEYYFWGGVVFLFISVCLSSLWGIRQNWGKDAFFSFVNSGQNSWCDMLFSMPLLTISYWISIVWFFVVYVWARCKKYREHFYRFRAVAEALRVQIFWRIAGMRGCVSGYYRIHQLAETDWLRAAINGLDVLLASPEDANFKKTPEERLAFVRDVWINGQSMFFHKRLEQGEPAYSHSNKEIWKPVFVLVLSLFVPFVSTVLSALHGWCALLAEIVQILYGFVLASIPFYGFLLFRKTVNQPRSELNRYKQMLFPFDRALLLLKSEPAVKDSQVILRQLGTEAISENASWLSSMGERKLILPR